MPSWASLCINLDLHFCVLRLDFLKGLSIISLILFLVFFFLQTHSSPRSVNDEIPQGWRLGLFFLLSLFVSKGVCETQDFECYPCALRPILASPNPSLSSKSQPYTPRYSLVTSISMPYTISSRKYPKRIPHPPSFCPLPHPTPPHCPCERSITFPLRTHAGKPSVTLSVPHHPS